MRSVCLLVCFWSSNRTRFFCTCHYIRNELKLPVTPRTVNNVLNKAGYYWRSLPRIQGLSKEQLGKRLVFVNAHIDFPPARWLAHFNMVMDGVPLTMAPETLSGREKHAAQRLTCNWTCEGERLNNDIPSACVRVHGVSSLPSIQEGQKHQRDGYLRLELFAPTPVAAVAQELHTLARKSGCGFVFVRACAHVFRECLCCHQFRTATSTSILTTSVWNFFSPPPSAALAQELRALAKKSCCGFCFWPPEPASWLPPFGFFFTAALVGAGAGIPHVG